MIWAGITDHYEEDVWVNPYTLEQSGMTFWEPGRPNGGVARNCARTYLGKHILFKNIFVGPEIFWFLWPMATTRYVLMDE